MDEVSRKLTNASKQWEQASTTYGILKKRIEMEARYQRVRTMHSDAYNRGSEWWVGTQLYSPDNTFEDISRAEKFMQTVFSKI
jgi:hypothetical protein